MMVPVEDAEDADDESSSKISSSSGTWPFSDSSSSSLEESAMEFSFLLAQAL